MRYSKKKKSQRGQSLMEILIGVAIAGLLAGTAATTFVLTTRTNQQSAAAKTASSLGQELIDIVGPVAEGSWNDVYTLSDKTASSTYYITGTSTLVVSVGTEDVAVGNKTFTRWFSIENVNRSATSGAITLNGSDPEDPSTQKITAWVQFPFRGGVIEITIVEYITRWRKDGVTVFTDWSGSSGVEGPITSPDSNYFATSGSIDVLTEGELKLN